MISFFICGFYVSVALSRNLVDNACAAFALLLHKYIAMPVQLTSFFDDSIIDPHGV